MSEDELNELLRALTQVGHLLLARDMASKRMRLLDHHVSQSLKILRDILTCTQNGQGPDHGLFREATMRPE